MRSRWASGFAIGFGLRTTSLATSTKPGDVTRRRSVLAAIGIREDYRRARRTSRSSQCVRMRLPSKPPRSRALCGAIRDQTPGALVTSCSHVLSVPIDSLLRRFHHGGGISDIG